jgi:hypothetical protein
MSQSPAHSHMETAINAVVGIPLSQGVLWIFGLPIGEAVLVGVVMFLVSYLRGFLVRRIFDWLT